MPTEYDPDDCELTLECECGNPSHITKVMDFSDVAGVPIISIESRLGYLPSFWKRLRLVWGYLRGTHEVTTRVGLNPEEVTKLIYFLIRFMANQEEETE